jgi:hypothetical protein
VNVFYLDTTTNKYQIARNDTTIDPQYNFVLNYTGYGGYYATIYFSSITTTKIILMFTPQSGKNIITLSDLFCSYMPPLIPTMTSNTEPSGYVASASTWLTYDIGGTTYNYPAYLAFNNSLTDAWISNY